MGSEQVSANGSPVSDDDEAKEEVFDYSALFDAPNYSQFIKTPPNSRAQGYQKRVESMMKAGLVMSLNNHQWPDAATFLKHGPGFAKAAGNLAAEDERAARLVDMLTAPDSPYLTFAMVAIPLVAQLVRNHEPAITESVQTWREKRAERKQAKKAGLKNVRVEPPITVRFFRWRVNLPVRFRVRFNVRGAFRAFLGPTQFPDEIAAEVFRDPAVVKALHKMGLFPRQAPSEATDE